MGDGFAKKEFRKTAIGKAIEHGASVLLDGPDGVFNLADMVISSSNTELSREEVGAKAFKFSISVDVGNEKTASRIELNDGLGFGKESRFVTSVDGRNGTKLKFAGNGVEKGEALDIKKIHAECNIAMKMKNVGRKGRGRKGRDIDGVAFGGFTL
jgi:hypothetical protein